MTDRSLWSSVWFLLDSAPLLPPSPSTDFGREQSCVIMQRGPEHATAVFSVLCVTLSQCFNRWEINRERQKGLPTKQPSKSFATFWRQGSEKLRPQGTPCLLPKVIPSLRCCFQMWVLLLSARCQLDASLNCRPEYNRELSFLWGWHSWNHSPKVMKQRPLRPSFWETADSA